MVDLQKSNSEAGPLIAVGCTVILVKNGMEFYHCQSFVPLINH